MSTPKGEPPAPTRRSSAEHPRVVSTEESDRAPRERGAPAEQHSALVRALPRRTKLGNRVLSNNIAQDLKEVWIKLSAQAERRPTIANERLDLRSPHAGPRDNIPDLIEHPRWNSSAHVREAAFLDAHDEESRLAIDSPQPNANGKEEKEKDDVAHVSANVT